jgi:hypothetical protein
MSCSVDRRSECRQVDIWFSCTTGQLQVTANKAVLLGKHCLAESFFGRYFNSNSTAALSDYPTP